MGFTKPQGKCVGGKKKKWRRKGERRQRVKRKKEKGGEKGSNLFATSGDYLSLFKVQKSSDNSVALAILARLKGYYCQYSIKIIQ